MPRHTDATGYLIELRDQELKQWFSLICDLALSAQNATITEAQLRSIVRVFLQQETYQPRSTSALNVSAGPLPGVSASTMLPWLELLSNFQNFKGLSTSLTLRIDKRITILFGLNGAGKSSLCDAIKTLASPQPPEKPLSNVKNPRPIAPSFSFKFTTDSAVEAWQESKGVGLFSDRIKYFDSTVAFRCLTEPATPETTISVEPFRIEAFSFAGAFVRRLNDELLQQLHTAQQSIERDIERVRTRFAAFVNDTAIAGLTYSNCTGLERLLTAHIPVDEAESHRRQNLSAELNRLEDATTETGLQLQRAEFKMLLSFARSLKSLKRCINCCSYRNALNLKNRLNELINHQTELAGLVAPEDVDMAAFVTFIQASQSLLEYDHITDKTPCPFCRRPLDMESIELCKRYHEFLLDMVSNSIQQVRSELQVEMTKLNKITALRLNEIDTSSFPAFITGIVEWWEELRAYVPDNPQQLNEANVSVFEDRTLIKKLIPAIAKEVRSRYRTLRLATGDAQQLEEQRRTLRQEIGSLEYRHLISENLTDLDNLASKVNAYLRLKRQIDDASFSILLRNLTNKSKEAYRELVVSEFERTLNIEYIGLSGQPMSDFGILLSSTGSDQTVIVDTTIGDHSVERVLSEGEQKIHALALFFAEASVGNQNIIVFDDPVTSFDYNYSARYAQRLRDYAQQAPQVQIIVLTHNWDFFVHLKSVLYKSHLNNDCSVQQIEQCSVVSEYTENIARLKDAITQKLGETGTLSLDDKEFIAAQMRRLIEAVVNTIVFNSQRHQLKQTTMSISTFELFTKLVPLSTTEAQKLRDLYGFLSVSEHDDPRNHYANIDRPTFSNWYDDICSIESALHARRP